MRIRQRIFDVLSNAAEKKMKRSDFLKDPWLTNLQSHVYEEVEAAEIAAERLEKWRAETGEAGKPYYLRLLTETPPEAEDGLF